MSLSYSGPPSLTTSTRVDPAPKMSQQKAGSGALILSQYIQHAIEEKRRGIPKDFDFVVQQLTTPPDSISLGRWLQGLKGCAPSLTKESHSLVDAALKVNWKFGDDATFALFLEFVEDLISSNAYFASSCLQFLISNIDYREDLSEEDNAAGFERVHVLLSKIFALVPQSTSVASPLITDNFPSKRQGIDAHRWYVKNMLKIITYSPALFDEFFRAIIQKLIAIDTQIQTEKGLREAKNQGDDDMMFKIDDDEQPIQQDMSEEMIMELQQKLDAMLQILFECIDLAYDQGTPESRNSLTQFLLQVFENYVMMTHKSRFVQYLFFFSFSKDENFPDIFLSFLCQILVDPRKSSIVRESAASYIAAFHARAKYVKVETVARCLDIVVTWLHAFIDHCEKDVLGELEPNKFPLFYYTSQAVFYTICFRHRELLSYQGYSDSMAKLQLDRIIKCKFNPLKICAPAIVAEFANITHRFQIVYCFSIIEKNRKIVPAGKHQIATEALSEELKSFYMFEPFELELSRAYIGSLYREYEPLPDDADQDDLVAPPEKGTRLIARDQNHHHHQLYPASAHHQRQQPHTTAPRQLHPALEHGFSTDDDSSDFLGGMVIPESMEDRNLADRFATSMDQFD